MRATNQTTSRRQRALRPRLEGVEERVLPAPVPGPGTLQVVSTNPADGSAVTYLPGGSITVTFNNPLAGLSGGQSIITASDPYAIFLLARGPAGAFSAPSGVDSGDVPLHAFEAYNVNSDGTSTVTITPTAPLSTDIYAISISGSLQDIFGDPLTNAQGQPGSVYTTFLYRPPTNSTALQVSSVTSYGGSTTIANNAINQPDTIAIGFNKPLDVLSVNPNTVQLLASSGAGASVVPSVAAYSPTTDAVYLTPTAPLSPGTVYVIRVAGHDAGSSYVSDDQGFPNPGYPLAQTFYDTFTVLNPPAGPGQGALQVAHRSDNTLAVTPNAGSLWTAPVGYAQVTFTRPVALSSLGRYSAMLVPRTGGLANGAFDTADTPLNDRLAFNPNTNQLIIVPTTPVGDDVYLLSLSNMLAANPDGSPNPSLPLTDPGGVPVDATFEIAAVQPSALEQETLYDLNRVRVNPQGELNYLFTSLNPLTSPDPVIEASLQNFGITTANFLPQWQTLTPAPPLAWNTSLYTASLAHNQAMIQADTQSHQLPGEPPFYQRDANAGYVGESAGAENIFAYATSVFNGDSAFLIDYGNNPPGHRINIMNPTYQEVGVGITPSYDPSKTVGPFVVTQDFGARPSYGNPDAVGVVYRDLNGDGRYEAGEGLANVTVTLFGAGGKKYTTTTDAAGGYQIKVPRGTYTAVAAGGLFAGMAVSQVTVGTANVEVDFLSGRAAAVVNFSNA